MPLASTTAAYTLIGLASKFQEFFYHDAGDVTFEYMNEDGERLTTTVPNVAKIEQNLLDNATTKRIYVNEDMVLEDHAYYTVDTSNSRTLTLPANPTNNDIRFILDGVNNAQNNPVNIERNGKKINNSETNASLDVNGFFILLLFNEAKDSWYLINDVGNSN
jgi:hypothetical protein